MRSTTPGVERIREIVTSEARRDRRILALYLLGSIAGGRLRDDSDIDIALMAVPGTTISSIEHADFAHTLTYKLGRPVDVGNLSSRNLVYANEALLRGFRIYSDDPDAADLYAATLLGLYLEFNESRKEIIDAYTF
jgi:predicted nucleotidyltransferase